MSGPPGAATPDGPGIPLNQGSETPVSKVTELALKPITATDHLAIGLVEADEAPTVVIIRWPAKPTSFHPRRFPSGAENAARIFASAVVALAQLRRERRR